MRVFIGGEESQEICKAFRKLGHEAYSCDLKDCSGGYPEWHIKDDWSNHLNKNWDLIIMHTDCTKVAVSGNGTYAFGKEKYNERLEVAKYVEQLWFKCISVCDKVCFENPVGVLTTLTKLPKPQYIQPYQFGHTETKKTGLFLHGLPKLKETNNVKEIMDKLPNKEKHKVWYASPGKNRGELRSKTYSGIAESIANQWSK
jgi:hypothetical protein